MNVRNDAAITQEEYEEVKSAVVKSPYDDTLSGRKVFSVKKVSEGRQTYKYYTLNDTGDAELVAKQAMFPSMKIDKTGTTVDIPKIGISFAIAKEDLMSSRLFGEALDTLNAERAAHKVDKKENDLIWNGSTAFGISGMTDLAGKTYSGADWSLTGTGDPYEDIRAAIAELDEDFTANGAVFNPAQYMELFRRESNTQKTYFELVKDALSVNLFKDTAVTAATGYVGQWDAGTCQLIVSENRTLETEQNYDMATQSYKFNVYVRSVPAVYQPNAFVKMSSI